MDVIRPQPQRIELHYVAEGDISRVRVSPVVPSERRDELWRHTCFEAFVRPPAGDAYAEFNFSPSTEYAGYVFTSYREGMRGAHCSGLTIGVDAASSRLELRVSLGLRVVEFDTSGPLRLGLSAIVEETDGSKSWWALAHPQGKPDFHHADSFALDLPAEHT